MCSRYFRREWWNGLSLILTVSKVKKLGNYLIFPQFWTKTLKKCWIVLIFWEVSVCFCTCMLFWGLSMIYWLLLIQESAPYWRYVTLAQPLTNWCKSNQLIKTVGGYFWDCLKLIHLIFVQYEYLCLKWWFYFCQLQSAKVCHIWFSFCISMDRSQEQALNWNWFLINQN